MTTRQRILKWLYPLIQWAKKNDPEKGLILFNKNDQSPLESLYSFKAVTNQGKEISLEQFRGKPLLIVNVASNCGYTGQYDELEKIYQANQEHLTILGVPSNDFKNQESGTDQEIEQFCRVNYGVTFPLLKKQSVIGPEQHEIYRWLTDKTRNGWNEQSPVWNFSKYLIDEHGKLKAFYGPSVSPLRIEI